MQAEVLFRLLELALSHFASPLSLANLRVALIAGWRGRQVSSAISICASAELSEGHCDILAGDRVLRRQSQRAPPGSLSRVPSGSPIYGIAQ